MATKNLNKYVRYLSEDLRAAATETITSKAPFPFDDPDDSDYVPCKLATLLDLSPTLFPPSDMLTKAQMAQLFRDFQRLLESRNISWYLPPHVTLKNRYEAIRYALEHSTIAYHFEFGGSLDLCLGQENNQCPYFDSESGCRCAQLKQEFWDSYYDFETEPDFFEPFSDELLDEDEEDEDESNASEWDDPETNEEIDLDDPALHGTIEDWFLRYFLDFYFDSLGNDNEDDDPRINWQSGDDDELPF